MAAVIPNPGWWARGLLFENCNCQAVCPGHVHFEQLCTNERCVGYWAVRFDEGEFDGVALAGARAVILYDSPQKMIEGNWLEALVIDAATPQRECVEAILTGSAGGPWGVLARFVGRRLATRHLPIRIEDEAKAKRVVIEGLLEGKVEALRGRDREQPVRFENMFNQIHAPSQVIGNGATRCPDGEIVIETDRTHALWSKFDWSVSRA